MTTKYNKLTGKTKEEVLELISENKINNINSDLWVLYIEKRYFWQKKFLHLFFEEGKVVLYRIVFKNFWNKGITHD
ncbi:hypothetical protein [Chryseobacterium sp. SIMBA_029]|uniref:hypothetical protein n=1 Tax=Chryseobacterium sp. SIMBA_029 TaxID=3085772 RepID=UPI00397A96D5